MLVISRKPGESIILQTPEGIVEVRLAQVAGNTVKLVVSAPKSIPISRKEVYDDVKDTNLSAVQDNKSPRKVPSGTLKPQN